MIKIRKVVSSANNTFLTIDYDLDGKVFSVNINAIDIEEKMKELRELLGRELTEQDLKDVIRSFINKIRKGERPFPQRFDYSKLINEDLEV